MMEEDLPQVDVKKMALRVKAVLMEMYGVGMPDQKALAFIGRVGTMYKLDKDQLAVLTPLPQKIWKSSLQQQQKLVNGGGMNRKGSITLRPGDAVAEEPREGEGEPLPGGRQRSSLPGLADVMMAIPAKKSNMSSNIFSSLLGDSTSHKGKASKYKEHPNHLISLT